MLELSRPKSACGFHRVRLTRSRVRALAAVLGGVLAMSCAGPASAFDFANVQKNAAELAKAPFHEPQRIPDWLLKITYDQWRQIRFRPDKALWRDRGSPFEVQFFHPGLFYDRTVAINQVDATGVHAIPYSPSLFDYGNLDFASKVPQDLGFAGFRVHYPIKRAEYKDEVIVFLGATYFRALGRDQVFGGSARAISIDTALPKGEEFPFFKEFWVVRPQQKSTEMTIFAVADSPSLTAAFKFVVRPGEQTTVAVDTSVYRRRPVEKLGIAPLTSMFYHGENTKRWYDDFRPEVHDSDGLLISLANGEWLWRPIDNPERLVINAFAAPGVRGFGMLQRDRVFDHYQDLETHQQDRPSVWIVPHGDWAKGHVELVEIPTGADYNDNAVISWVPALAADAKDPLSFSYTMSWYGTDATRPPDGRTVSTRRETGSKPNYERFVVDFEGKQLAQLKDDTVLRAVVSVASGEQTGRIVEQLVTKNTITGGWRLVFQVEVASSEPVELRAFLDRGGEALTETWTYTLLR